MRLYTGLGHCQRPFQARSRPRPLPAPSSPLFDPLPPLQPSAVNKIPPFLGPEVTRPQVLHSPCFETPQPSILLPLGQDPPKERWMACSIWPQEKSGSSQKSSLAEPQRRAYLTNRWASSSTARQWRWKGAVMGRRDTASPT